MSRREARVVIGMARIEAVLLARNVLVLAGLVAAGLTVWQLTVVNHAQLVWWNSGWQIGFGQLVLSVLALVAAQLATTRARRDGLAELYASFPTAERTRAVGHLVGVLGVVVPSAALAGVMTALFEVHGILGSPDVWVLAAGVLLAVAGAVIGVAIGRWLAHPMAGIIAAFAWFALPGQSDHYNNAIVWLFPWSSPQLTTLPGPLTGYPPAVAHAAGLAGIALLAGVVAVLARPGRRERAPRMWSRAVSVGIAGLVSAAVIAAAGIAELRPVPTDALARAVNTVAHPDVQRCTLVRTGAAAARYCLYPAFAPLRSDLEPVVGSVFKLAPGARHAQPLLIAQTSQLYLDDRVLTAGQSRSDIAAWQHELDTAPASQPSTSAVYLDLSNWPAAGHRASARFALAVATAEWAIGLPTSSGTPPNHQPCAPLDQAREAIAIWLADQATHTTTTSAQVIPANGYAPIMVAGQYVMGWFYPGQYGRFLNSPGPQLTASGNLLAAAMNRLATRQVSSALAAHWSRWTDRRTTDSQLAAALGIAMPQVPTTVTPTTRRIISGPAPSFRTCG